jgi:hypothetical protein
MCDALRTDVGQDSRHPKAPERRARSLKAASVCSTYSLYVHHYKSRQSTAVLMWDALRTDVGSREQDPRHPKAPERRARILKVLLEREDYPAVLTELMITMLLHMKTLKQQVGLAR